MPRPRPVIRRSPIIAPGGPGHGFYGGRGRDHVAGEMDRTFRRGPASDSVHFLNGKLFGARGADSVDGAYDGSTFFGGLGFDTAGNCGGTLRGVEIKASVIC